MRTEREQLTYEIAACGARPDGRFAEWLHANGERTRAEYIRLASVNGEDSRQKATVILNENWRTFFAPVLAVLDPVRKSEGFILQGGLILLPIRQADAPLFARHYIPVHSGVIDRLVVDLAAFSSGHSLDAVLRMEPISRLTLHISANKSVWPQVSSDALDQIRFLDACGWSENKESAGSDFTAIMNDPRFTSVQNLSLSVHDSNMLASVPHSFAFAYSILSRNIRSLHFHGATSLSLAALAGAAHLQLESLYLDGRFSAEAGQMLSAAHFAKHLKQLMINDSLCDFDGEPINCGSITPMFSAICRGKSWSSLTFLHIYTEEQGSQITAAGLKALAKAHFLPNLKELHLPLESHPDTRLIAAIVEKIDPNKVNSLRFENCGGEPVPDCLLRTFGSRVKRSVDNDSWGDNSWYVSCEN